MDLPFTLSTDPPITVRRMRRGELGIAIDLAGDEGWNPGLYDAETFWAADPDGFFVLEDDGRVIGTVSVVRYGDDFAFGGLYVLLPEYRGRGIGYALQQEFTLPYAGLRNLGIDGVFGMQSRYASAGFLFAYRNVRFEGSGGGISPAGVIPLEEVSFEAVAEYDRPFFPGPREEFLRAFLAQPDAIGYGATTADGDLAGYGLARPCRTGYKVGPLFADKPATAERLFRSLSAAVPGEPLYLDVPEPNGDAIAMAARYGMHEVFGTARMYTRSVPVLPLDRIYGITTFELG
ncbi:MAG: GNAT family N-acetyltransferase [Methanospirillum sp.]